MTKELAKHLKNLAVHIRIKKDPPVCEHTLENMFKINAKDGKTYEIGMVRGDNYVFVLNGKFYNENGRSWRPPIFVISIFPSCQA